MSYGFVHEYKCGCIIHSVAGNLRKCEGLNRRTSSGRLIPKPEGAEHRHNNAMNPPKKSDDGIVRTYTVAEILP
jgi:hypothetical protein